MNIHTTIGHNNPPDDAQILIDNLRERHNWLTERTEALCAAASKVPSITDADTAERVTTLIAQINAASKAIDTSRQEEKAPHLANGRTVDMFFKTWSGPLNAAKSQATAKLTAWQVEQRRKEQERQERLRQEQNDQSQARQTQPKTQTPITTNTGQTATLRRVTTITIDDVEKIPATFFRQYIAPEAIEKAARAAIKAGVKDIPGITITETQQTIVR